MRQELAGDALHDACRQLLARIHQLTDLRIEGVRDLPLPHQGASGAEVRLVRVRWCRHPAVNPQVARPC
ncbi:MAG: hypothetical protein OXG07_06505 [Anaerolineaceae bacterium]|nr:hypothetical protein [Anaerolineaceae bacterium]